MSTPRSIAYLGNSLTVQKAGYRTALHQRLEQYWGASLHQVNAGLGGVGSLACAILLDFLVLRHLPDLCLIECSAADMLGATSPAQIGPSLETIVRELLAASVEPVLLHLPWRDSEPVPRANTLAAYQSVADHYRIPSLSLWDRWHPHDGALLDDGKHLTRQGGREVADTIVPLLAAAWMQRVERPRTTTPHPLHRHRTQWLAAAASDPRISPTEHCRRRRFRLSLPMLELPVAEAVTITPPAGEAISGLLVVADNDSGVVELSSHGQRECVQIRDQWCDQPRLQLILLDPAITERLQLQMTRLSNADRDCRHQPSAPMAPGTMLRLIGAACTGTPPLGRAPWWQEPLT
jgi:acyl-CoA thioesterase I